MERIGLHMEGNESQDIKQWAASQWEESDISIRSLDALDLESHSTDIERATSGSIHEIWKAPTTDQNSDHHKQLVKLEMVSWDGPNDPSNPMNWPARKKIPMLCVLGMLTMLTLLASSMFAPAIIEVSDEFGISNESLSTFAVTVYLLGFAVGGIVLGPLSERYGRIPIYHGSNVFFVAFTIACAVSDNVTILIVSRFLAGCVGCVPMILNNPTIGDFTPPEKRGPLITLFGLFAMMGPVIGPIGGGFLSGACGWRWVFGVISIVSGVMTIAGFFLLRETYPPVLLERKVAKLRKETGNVYIRSEYTRASSQYILHLFIRPIKLLVFSPVALLLSLYMAIAFSYLYWLFATVPIVFQETYDFSQSGVGLVFLGLGIGMLTTLAICLRVIPKFIERKKARGAVYTPETLLPLMIPGAFVIPISLFWYGWSLERHAHYMIPIVATGFLGASFLSTYIPLQVYLVDAFTIYSASAVAASVIFRCILGTFLPMAGTSMLQVLGSGLGNSILGCISIVILPVPFVFLKYGAWLRWKYPVRF